MNDMRAVIVPKSDQINADDLLGGPMTVTITNVTIKPGSEQPVSIFFEGDNGKPYKPCKSMARVMVHCWGHDANQYIGRGMTLYCDPAVRWGGMEVGGIRISHMTNLNGVQTMALTATKGSKKPFTVKPLIEAPAATASSPLKDKYPTLFGIKDGAVWLDNLAAVLAPQTTMDGIAEVRGLSPVTKALQHAPEATQAKITALLDAAADRIRETEADPEFGDDAPSDDAQEAA